MAGMDEGPAWMALGTLDVTVPDKPPGTVITGVYGILITVKKMILSFIQIVMNITLGQHHLMIVMNTTLGQHHLMLSSVITTCFVIANISK